LGASTSAPPKDGSAEVTKPVGARAFRRVCDAEELPKDRPFGAAVDGQEVVLVPSAFGLRAYEGRCPHQGTLLSEGELTGGTLVCRAHGWRFDAATGARVGGEGGLSPLPCRVVQGAVEVEVETRTAPTSSVLGPRRTVADLPGPRGWPLLGNALALKTERVHHVLEDWARRYGPLYRFHLGRKPVVVVSDARLNEAILRARPGAFRRLAVAAEVIAEVGAAGVFSAEGESWRRQRRLAMEALGNHHLKAFYPTLKLVADRLLLRWERAAASGEERLIEEDLMRFTVDATTSLAFGVDMNTLEHDEVIQRHLALVFPAVAARIFAPFPYWRYLRLPADRRLDRALKEIHGTLESLIASARARLAEGQAKDVRPANMLEAMLLAREEDGSPYADSVISGNVLTMLLAGEDTTAHSVGWLVHELCERPDVQARLRAEVDTALGASRLPEDVETASRLPYLDAVNQEVMRLRPVAPFQGLETNEAYLLDDVLLPVGTQLIVLSRLPALQATNFAQPADFLPQRWLKQKPTQEAPRPHVAAASVPFGSGPRLCPGRSLALLEIRVLVATLFKNFEIERVGARDAVSEAFAFTLFPKNLRVRLHRRTAPAPTASAH
jgi:cytochrome P450/nitrite reductase/ring-hydroxylating ferredoxin subunit